MIYNSMKNLIDYKGEVQESNILYNDNDFKIEYMQYIDKKMFLTVYNRVEKIMIYFSYDTETRKIEIVELSKNNKTYRSSRYFMKYYRTVKDIFDIHYNYNVYQG